jgi:ankyrin repeat protein
MWLVLVIEILNKEYRRGGMSLRKRLAEIPSDLSELFKDMLRRDNENAEALLLCILWILLAKRPLQPREFFHALWSGLSRDRLADERIPDIDTFNTADISDKYNTYVITASKGLAEITKPQLPSVEFIPTVQFIHESVRDFLIKENGLQQMWPEFGLDYESASHEKLKECCSFYIKYTLAHVSIQRSLLEPNPHKRKQVSKTYPFLKYATQQILYHANAAAISVPQNDFLRSFSVSNWVHTNNLYGSFSNHEYSSSASLFYLLADKGLSELIRTRLKEDPEIHVSGERYRYPLFAALANGHNEAICALLNAPSSIPQDQLDTTQYLDCGHFENYEDRTPLSWAAENGRAVIIKLLLQGEIAINEIDRGGRTPLSRASENGQEVAAGLLIDKGAHIDVSDKEGLTPLLWAMRNNHKSVALLLVNRGANVNASNRLGTTPLICASVNGDDVVARILIEHGADVTHSDKGGWTPLMYASMNGHETIARLLINKGADVNARNRHGSTPLTCASRNGHEAVVELLASNGAS